MWSTAISRKFVAYFGKQPQLASHTQFPGLNQPPRHLSAAGECAVGGSLPSKAEGFTREDDAASIGFDHRATA